MLEAASSGSEFIIPTPLFLVCAPVGEELLCVGRAVGVPDPGVEEQRQADPDRAPGERGLGRHELEVLNDVAEKRSDFVVGVVGIAGLRERGLAGSVSREVSRGKYHASQSSRV